MKITLEKEEVLKFIHSALCNGGLSDLASSGLELNVSDEDYSQARKEISENGFCVEDVWIQILRSGKPLTFFDHEEEEEVSFDINKATEELSKEQALDLISIFKSESDDSWTGYELLQRCLYGKVIFG